MHLHEHEVAAVLVRFIVPVARNSFCIRVAVDGKTLPEPVPYCGVEKIEAADFFAAEIIGKRVDKKSVRRTVLSLDSVDVYSWFADAHEIHVVPFQGIYDCPGLAVGKFWSPPEFAVVVTPPIHPIEIKNICVDRN